MSWGAGNPLDWGWYSFFDDLLSHRFYSLGAPSKEPIRTPMRQLRTHFAKSLLGALLVSAAAADTIYTIDGDTIEDVTVRAEELSTVTYRTAGSKKDKTVSADQVLRVNFSSKPALIDSADSAVEDGAYFPAINDLEEFLVNGAKEARKFPWAKAYSVYRVMEINLLIGEYEDAVKAADRVLADAGESRYVPLAHLGKARALFDSGKAADATAAVATLKELADSGKVGARWGLEAEVHQVLFNADLKGSARVTKLTGLVTRAANDFSIVANRARVAAGEASVTVKDYAGAEKFFRAVLDEPQADSRTLAGAYSGLGNCLYAQAEGAGSDGAELYREALMAYMRVVVNYELEFAYVPHSMLYAGLCFRGMGGEEDLERATVMLLRVRQRFPGSREAEEAKSLR